VFGHSWEPGTATIVAVHIKSTTGDGMVSRREYAADVVLGERAPTRVLLQEPMFTTNFWPPDVGDVVRVDVDLKSGKVKFDKSDPKISAKARMAAIDDDFHTKLSGRPE
jgi:hypothetical protein